jgi:hypothetical protein
MLTEERKASIRHQRGLVRYVSHEQAEAARGVHRTPR